MLRLITTLDKMLPIKFKIGDLSNNNCELFILVNGKNSVQLLLMSRKEWKERILGWWNIYLFIFCLVLRIIHHNTVSEEMYLEVIIIITKKQN